MMLFHVAPSSVRISVRSSGGKNLAQTEIGLLSLVQAKDLVPQPGRGRG